LGRPFLATAKAIIYANATKIIFTLNGRKERFNWKNKILKALAHPRYPYPQEHEPVVEKKRRDRRRNKKNNRPQPHVKEVWMINTVQLENKNLFSPLLPNFEDPGVPSIHCTINQWNFQGVVYDTGSGIKLMSKVTYKLIYGDLPWYSTYIMLQMEDQSQRFPEGIARYVPVKIKDHYVLTNFLVIHMGDEQDPPIVIGRPFLNTRAIIYIRTGEIHFQFRTEKVRCYFNTYTNPEQPKKNKTRRRLQKLQRTLNTKLMDVQNIEEEIKEKSAQLLSAHYSEPVTPERSPPKKQIWRKKDQSTPSEDQSLPASSTDQSMATTSTPWE
jgi:hypothetical protein